MEFAIIGPVLIMMLMGIVSYGGYFWMAHSVQQLANDAARASIAGLDASERSALAQTSVSAGLNSYAYLKAASTAVSVQSSGEQIAIEVNYDASSSPFLALDNILPMPSPTIRRKAVVLLGGY